MGRKERDQLHTQTHTILVTMGETGLPHNTRSSCIMEEARELLDLDHPTDSVIEALTGEFCEKCSRNCLGMSIRERR